MSTPENPAALDAQAGLSRLDAQHLESQRRANEIADLMNSDSAHEVQKYLAVDDNGVTWRELMTEIGGVQHLHEYLTSDGHPDPARINPVIDRIFERTAVAEYAGGMTMRRYPKNRDRR